MQLGLRIDVDTLRGTQLGVPRLVQILGDLDLKATFFFSLGPDNMGRHVWRLLRPRFALKMLRTRASKLYGWRTLLNGTFFPGPMIGDRAADQIRLAADEGHEIGLHAWDHHAWQRRVDLSSAGGVGRELRRGYDALQAITGGTVRASATPAWMTSDEVCRQKLEYPFLYNSDCRGEAIFEPRLGDGSIGQVQIPTTMPTYDEVIGVSAESPEDFYRQTAQGLRPDALNVYTAHAEVEGMSLAEPFRAFLESVVQRGWRTVNLVELLKGRDGLPRQAITRGVIPGRDGWMSWQAGNP